MKGIKKVVLLIACVILTMGTVCVWAASEDAEEKIKKGVSIDSVDVSGMTASEATKALKTVVSDKTATTVTLDVNGKSVQTTLGNLGYKWSNKTVVDEAVNTGKIGNIIKRYKDGLDLQHNGMKFNVEMSFNKDTLKKKLQTICAEYEIKAQNASLEATGHGFKIIKEKEGVTVDYDKTVEQLYTYVTEKWNKKANIKLTATTTVSKPKYTTEDCEKVSNEPMGSYTTEFSVGSSYANRNLNIQNGAKLINGAVVYPGEQYSCNENLYPWTEDNGWHPAGTYVDGGVQDSLGGGICQVSSTLYNALLRAEIKVVKRFPHSMAVGYVPLSADAALAGDYKDLKFVNNLDAPIYIEGYTVGKDIYFNIYGQETRPSNRKVTYESEVVSEEDPGTQFVATGDAVGSISTTQGKHMGYVARLWKIVTVDGVEQSRDAINKSTYKSSPKIVNVGTASADPNATAAVNAALATGDEATIYATVAQYSGAGQTPAETPAETPADGSAEAAAILGTVDESQITENTTTEGQ